MPADLSFSIPTLLSFLLVLARVSGCFVFIPLPGVKNTPEVARAVISLTMTLALLPFWPVLKVDNPDIGQVVEWLFSEGAFGITLGLIVTFLTEAYLVGAQMLALQAGYSYASTIDPTNQSDSGVLQVIVQLMTGILFFTLGLDREILRILARSLQLWPPGAFMITESLARSIINLGSQMFSTGLRLALPIVALLLLVDLSLALLGRVNQHLQLISLAFPLKMLGALLALAGILTIFPAVYEKSAQQSLRALMQFGR
jgi:flagellar biosynthetic protein FliR